MAGPRLVSDGIRRGKIEKPKGELDYCRFRERFRGIERGTVLCGSRVIFGFPHIKRIFTLERGISRNMPEGEIYAEEKIDGFNLRIAQIDGRVYAFSRGGFLDSFATEKARAMGFSGFFREFPGHVLCGEMIGNTPHTPPSDDFDVKLFIFDIDQGDGSYLPCAEKYAMQKKHGLIGAPVLGKFRSGEISGLKRLALNLNKSRREGMVLKSANRGAVVKYVTPWSDIDDIQKCSRILFDMPIGFYYQRILRSAFFMEDFGLGRDEYSKKLGRAFYEGLTKAIADAKAGREIGEEFEISIIGPGIWNDIRSHMSKEVRIEELWRKRDGAMTRIRFRKIFKKTTKTLAAYAGGKGITD